ncbi:MAG: T9SS type A sorting domain-containing protein [candidate division WOR-3 bacterium]
MFYTLLLFAGAPEPLEVYRAETGMDTRPKKMACPISQSSFPQQIIEEVVNGQEISVAELMGGGGWFSNEIQDPSIPGDDAGYGDSPDIVGDALGGLWAIVSETMENNSRDTIKVYYSGDDGQTWVHKISIVSATAGYHPHDARLSVDRYTNYIYFTNILSTDINSTGALFAGRWRHTGGGNITDLATVNVSNDYYGSSTVAADGANNGYVYLAAYYYDGLLVSVDVWRSPNRGNTWTLVDYYEPSWSLSNSMQIGARYGNSGVIVSFGAQELLAPWRVYYALVNSSSSSIDWYYFNMDFNTIVATDCIGQGNRLLIWAEDEKGTYNHDLFIFYSTDGGANWYGGYRDSSSLTDTRMPALDVDGTGSYFYAAHYFDSGRDGYGRPYFLRSSNMWTYTPWPGCEIDCTNGDSVPSGSPSPSNLHIWDIGVCAGYSNTLGTWIPHVVWRRIGGVGGYDAWHSTLDDILGTSEDEDVPFMFSPLATVGKGLIFAYSAPEGTSLELKVYNAAGALVRKESMVVSGPGRLSVEGLPSGTYIWRASLGQERYWGKAAVIK